MCRTLLFTSSQLCTFIPMNMLLSKRALAITLSLTLFMILNAFQSMDDQRLVNFVRLFPYTGPVNDYADMLAPDEEAILARQMTATEKASGISYAFFSIASLDVHTVRDVGITMGYEWFIESERNDKGILILMAQEDEQLFISTTQEVRLTISDERIRYFVDQIILPEMMAGGTYAAISKAVEEMNSYYMVATAQEPGTANSVNGDQSNSPSWMWIIISGLGGIIVGILIKSKI